KIIIMGRKTKTDGLKKIREPKSPCHDELDKKREKYQKWQKQLNLMNANSFALAQWIKLYIMVNQRAKATLSITVNPHLYQRLKEEIG
ncbi:12861_t:CDS:2, partial [Funneliformis geosporum]